MNRQPLICITALAILATLSMLLTACGAPATIAPTIAPTVITTSKLKAVATFSFLGDFVQNVAGDKIELVTLVGPGGDTHEFEPAPSDAAKIADATIIFEDGIGFEMWLDPLYKSANSKAVRVVASAGVTTRKLVEDGKEETDPHIWQDPTRAMQMVKNIRDGLMKADPANATAYQANADAYLAKIEVLDKELEGQIATLPKDQRKIVTSHDALGYYAERYGFDVIGSALGSVSTEATDPSAQDFAGLVDEIKKTGVKAIFLENITKPERVERLAKEAGVKVVPELYTDALGAAGTPGATYLEALRYNTKAILEALK